MVSFCSSLLLSGIVALQEPREFFIAKDNIFYKENKPLVIPTKNEPKWFNCKGKNGTEINHMSSFLKKID